MLAPQPGRTATFPKPLKIVSKSALFKAWNGSRDATRNSGRPGVDNVHAQQFAAKLDSNLAEIVRLLREGKYGFSRLRPVFVPKPNSDKERMICVPTVRDRLVQRVIGQYLTEKKLFPIYNSSSFGFIKGRGTREAIDAAVKLRGQYDWCLKTDIESFFDRIPRQYLKDRVYACLKSHSLTPLIYDVIDREAKVTPENRAKIEKQNIKAGLGIRQGMPLSPILANLALADFDRDIKKNGIEMVRYADDLILFFETKEQAVSGQKLVKSLLQNMQLSIPDIADGSKTAIVAKSDSLSFLGREIVFLGSSGKFVARVAGSQMLKIEQRLADEFSFSSRTKNGKTFQDTIVDLSKSVSAYLGIYKDADNYAEFEARLRGRSRGIIVQIFKDIFGQNSLSGLSAEGRKFLGIEILDAVEPNPELDV
jgi:group II intron reverse transcriptase/maturase